MQWDPENGPRPTRRHLPAVRALRALLRRETPACEADALFDGGEFSGPALAEAAGMRWDALLAIVASRYGISEAELDDALHDCWTLEIRS